MHNYIRNATVMRTALGQTCEVENIPSQSTQCILVRSENTHAPRPAASTKNDLGRGGGGYFSWSGWKKLSSLFPSHSHYGRRQALLLLLLLPAGPKLRFARDPLEEVLGADLVPLRWAAHDLRQHHLVPPFVQRSDCDDLFARLVADAGQRELVFAPVSGEMRPVHRDLVALLADYILPGGGQERVGRKGPCKGRGRQREAGRKVCLCGVRVSFAVAYTAPTGWPMTRY